RDRWFQARGGSALRQVAYFSPEFGIAEAVPQYSGGLGVLAGDHLKAASSLGVPLVGMGLFYRHGYFRQSLSSDGWQQERFPSLDPFAMALRPVDAHVTVELAGTPLHARIWRADVGRIRLYLLDTDVDDNDDASRTVTDRLYGGDTEHRLRQEILLGMGGVRALDAIGETPQVFHTNEGHAGFLGLERIRRLVVNDGLDFDAALEATRAANIFTTHTPVPAGIDRFPRPLMEKYFSSLASECGVTMDELMAIGHDPDDGPDAPFNMAVMGLRLAGRANAVAKLHGAVSRTMFSSLWPGVPEGEVPITSVTNGVHATSWTSRAMADLFERAIHPEWHEAGVDDWARVRDVGDDEIWRVREQERERLVQRARVHLRDSLQRRGVSASETSWCDEVLDPRALTICFARRFATYKRATLLLSQPDRLRSLLLSVDRPVQLVFAGKAHPADDAGKELIRQIVTFSTQPDVRHRMIFLDDYDIALARMLLQGADVWLNTPRRPQEACGTSGMKATLNGALNLSVLDGWWDEQFNGENGWAISSAESIDDLVKRDHVEAESLFGLLEREIVPMFYERHQGPLPRRWLRHVKESLASLGPEVIASRMVRDYVERLYEPTATRADALGTDRGVRAIALAGWKERVRHAWKAVHIDAVETDTATIDLGGSRTVTAVVALGDLGEGDAQVQLLHGPVGQNDELEEPEVIGMASAGAIDEAHVRFSGTFSCDRPGRYGFTVRVVPIHPDLVTPVELGLVSWA
ncbi:MAG: glycogen phosphorylase, partial [Actinomycetota bacterium]|nr:glycogen phosphorylase [Actinomycetota bacterium]